MSVHYETVGLGLFAALSLLPAVPALLFTLRWILKRDRSTFNRALAAVGVAAAIYAAVCIDAFFIEPNWPQLRRLSLPSPLKTPLTVLHLSDLHLEADMPRRERWLLEQLELLRPDLILVTGDIHQMEHFDVENLRRVLQHLKAPLGVYACVGFDHVQVLQEAAPQMRMLLNEGLIIEHGGERIGLAGLTDAGKRAPAYDVIADADFRIVINHTPDLIEEAATQDAHLYLCGHTHGGQVRIPFWGAIITNTGTGKRFESGLYRVGNLLAYTSRGLGLEPPPAPPVRFFCRPEITLIELEPSE